MQPRSIVACAVLAIIASAACGDIVGGPEILRPIIRVKALDFFAGQQSSSLKVGASTRLMLIVYFGTDSGADPGALWSSRNATVASSLEAGVTGRSPGTTYVVGELTDRGIAFRDSVRITVTP